MQVRLGARNLFPQLQCRAYLNHAAISPPSSRVTAALHALLRDYETHGIDAFFVWQEKREQYRNKIAQFLGTDPKQLAFVANTTTGVTNIALCHPWRPGQSIVCFRGEFPTNVTPWQQAAKQNRLDLVMLQAPCPREDSAKILARLEDTLTKKDVGLVAVSAVQFQTGMRMPIEEMGVLCRRHGSALFVDAIQACGIVSPKLDRIDYLACGSHKWLMGTEGVGLLYVSAERSAALRPAVAGWLSHQDGLDFLQKGPGHLRYDRNTVQGPAFMEAGMQNTMGSVALGVAVETLAELGEEAIFEHVDHYLDRLEQGLLTRGFHTLRSAHRSARSGILSLQPPQGIDIVALHAHIDPKQVSCAIPDGLLRFAPHFANNIAEVPLVLRALDTAMERLG
jgi:cysteine desulfurase / selenocysteine lyase